MSDRLQIVDLRVNACIGATDGERETPQELRLQISLELDLARAGQSDRLDETVHYGHVAREILAHVEASRFALIERLATSICEFVLERHRRVDALTVRVEKPGAVKAARLVAAEIRRARAADPASGADGGGGAGAGAS